MVKILQKQWGADLFRLLFILFLLGYLSACTKEELPPEPEPPEPPIESSGYFESVGATKTYTAQELIEKAFDLDPGESLPIKLPNLQVKVEEIKYHTTDPQGDKVIASGIISYPVTGGYDEVVLAEHITISADKEAPSNMMCAMESALALFNCFVISPDYIGFGATKDKVHPYLHTENTAQVSIDMLFAVREYMASLEETLPKDIYIVGYSQGGAAALAVQKMIEEKYASDITINKTMAGGGPYDLTAIFDQFTETDYTGYPCSVPMVIIGMDNGDNLQLNYNKVFTGDLLTHYKEWINSKKYTTGAINGKLATNTISHFIHADMFTEKKNSEFTKLYASLAKNSLIDWKPKAPVMLVHGEKDEAVPFVCAQNAFDSFTAKGCHVELTTVPSDHKGSAISFYMKVLLEFI